MPNLQVEAIATMTIALRKLEGSIDAPIQVPYKDSFVYRYAHKGIYEAIIQKLVRMISGLNAIYVLLSTGFTQEIGVLLRTLDEIQEDIFFLASADPKSVCSERHAKYLDAFYAEAAFSRQEGSLEIPKPNLLPRKKIRAHTVNALGNGINATQALIASESIGTVYSGYVHAASENVMEMYGGFPPRFHVNGMLGTPRVIKTKIEIENYIYRGLMATVTAALALGDRPLAESLDVFLANYESANGHEQSERRKSKPSSEN